LPEPDSPDEPEGLALGDLEADAVHRLHRADGLLPEDPAPDWEVLLEVVDREERAV
jgi:hypothetical protein